MCSGEIDDKRAGFLRENVFKERDRCSFDRSVDGADLAGFAAGTHESDRAVSLVD